MYFRKATVQEVMDSINNFDMPTEVKMILLDERKAKISTIKKYRQSTKQDIRLIKDSCKIFLGYLNAWDDINNGKDVFVKY